MTAIFDTHAHYDDKAFAEDRDALLADLPAQGIAKVVNVGASMGSCERTIELMNRYDYVYGAIGIHPTDTAQLDEASFAWLREQCQLEKCVAVGEIGLDYYWDEPDREIQKRWFVRQIDLARELHKPMIIHSRDAAEDTLRVMRNVHAQEICGVIHCFSGSAEIAKEYTDMGFYIGVGGVVTFKNGKKLKEVVETMPLDKLVIETDCPYRAPVPHRGKRNDSTMLKLVIEEIAALRGMAAEEVERVTEENACRLYGLV